MQNSLKPSLRNNDLKENAIIVPRAGTRRKIVGRNNLMKRMVMRATETGTRTTDQTPGRKSR